MIIGLTGGIASGKSAAGEILKELGADIIDADKIAREVLERGTPGWQQVREYFGDGILLADGQINRKMLGEIVFKNSKQRRKLEEITHPLIIEKIREEIEEKSHGDRRVVLIAPLLYETGLDEMVDQVWVIYVDRVTQLQRLQNRDNLNRAEAVRRIEAQLSLEKKRRLADVVIDNRGSIADLRAKIQTLWKKLDG